MPSSTAKIGRGRTRKENTERIEREKREERGHALQSCRVCVNIIMDWVATVLPNTTL